LGRSFLCRIAYATVSAIAIDRLTVVRGGRPVLDGLSLTVSEGRITGLLGPSGCGKSTLMRSIVGVQRIASGSLRVLGDVAGDPALRSRVGYLTQAPSVYADLTVRENLRYFGRVLDVSDDAVEHAIETVDLAGAEDDRVDRLSGGQRARVSLAAAMLGSPPLLVLDEPTVGLDPVLRVALWDGFRRLADAGTTLLVSSHVMDEAERCDDIVLMREGALLAAEPRQRLLERTGCERVEDAFLKLVGEAAA
jgi:ABC-2 type transport system ATP-binding protein